jgi:hypothetical protein
MLRSMLLQTIVGMKCHLTKCLAQGLTQRFSLLAINLTPIEHALAIKIEAECLGETGELFEGGMSERYCIANMASRGLKRLKDQRLAFLDTHRPVALA